ncbi:MAG: PAS domain-containing sensor histidine kinase [Halococcoides sp.]
MSRGRSAGEDVLEHSPTPQIRLVDGRIDYANGAARELFDRELIGERLLGVVDPPEREHVWSALAGCEETALEFATPDGRQIDSEWRRTGPGTLVGSLRDVTDRRERRADLERDSEMLDTLLENLPMSIYIKDRQSRHVRVSDDMLCSSPESTITNQEGKEHHHSGDIIGKTDFDLYDPEFAAAAVDEDREIMATEEPMIDELAESTTNLGETIVTRTTKAPRYDDEGNVIGIVGVTQDVTDRVLTRRDLERQNERLEEFTEVLAHDLRNPLDVARGNIELIDGNAEAVSTIDDALERMSELIGEIRSFVLESRSVEDPAAVDLDAIAWRAWESVETNGATLDVRTTRRVRADPDRLRRLFENVYRNAIEHGTTDGSVAVVVADLDDGFVIADDGPGAPEECRDRIFERGVSTSEDGTGFGLAIVENIASAHGWSVEMADAVDPYPDLGGAAVPVTGVVRVEE